MTSLHPSLPKPFNFVADYKYPALVIEACCSILCISLPQLINTEWHMSEKRSLTVGALREICRLSYPEIAVHFGRKHHTSQQYQGARYYKLTPHRRGEWIALVQAEISRRATMK